MTAPPEDPTETPADATWPVDPVPATGHRPALILAVSLAVVLGVVAAVFGVIALRGDGEDRSDEVREVAGRFGAALLTYDHQDPEGHRDAVLDLATGSFRSEYADAFDRGLAQIITEVAAVSQGFVKEIYVSEIDEERAQAVVVLDVEITGAAGPRTLFDQYILLHLVEAGGGWKVDQVTDLNFEAGGRGAATSTTTTTAPDDASTSVP